MPDWEIIGLEEKKALSNLINEGGCLFAHGLQIIEKDIM